MPGTATSGRLHAPCMAPVLVKLHQGAVLFFITGCHLLQVVTYPRVDSADNPLAENRLAQQLGDFVKNFENLEGYETPVYPRGVLAYGCLPLGLLVASCVIHRVFLVCVGVIPYGTPLHTLTTFFTSNQSSRSLNSSCFVGHPCVANPVGRGGSRPG